MRCFSLTFHDSYLVAVRIGEIVGCVYTGWIPLSIGPSGDSNSILVSFALTLTDVMEWGHFWRERKMESEKNKEISRKREREREQKLSQLWILKWLHVSHVFWLSSMLQARVMSAQLLVGHDIYFYVLFSYLLILLSINIFCQIWITQINIIIKNKIKYKYKNKHI